MSDQPDLDTLIHRADLDGLVRRVDQLCVSRQWAELLDVRDRARAAVTTGRQLWPVATLAEYRLALWAPAAWAARVLDEASGHFSIGPLTEVVAQHHTAAELHPLIDDSVRFGFIAHERALRGETIDPTTSNPLEIPFVIQAWEPAYPLATYSDDAVDAPAPPPIDIGATNSAPNGRVSPVADQAVELAVRQLFEVWTASSNGHADVVCVEGTAADAVRALGVRAPRLRAITLGDALAWLMWAGASGAAHGRRRGAASGRFATWWLLAAFTDLSDEWPPDPGELGEAAAALRWHWWDTTPPAGQCNWPSRTPTRTTPGRSPPPTPYDHPCRYATNPAPDETCTSGAGFSV